MKFYSVLENPNVLSNDTHIFHREGFSFFALIFPLFFSIFNGLWMLSIFVSFYLLILIFLFNYFENLHQITFIFFLFPHIIFSFEARNFKKNILLKKGWRKVGFIMGKNLIDAEIRFYNSNISIKNNQAKE